MSSKIEWVEIPAGRYLHGLDKQQLEYIARIMGGGYSAKLTELLEVEAPQREVELPRYYISRFPVTIAQYRVFLEDGHSFLDHPYFQREETQQQPVTSSWLTANHFAAWCGARLPTTHEWEKAARGTDGRLFPWGNESNESYAFFNRKGAVGKVQNPPGEKRYYHCDIGLYPQGASPYGLEDLVGNVYNWTMSQHLPDINQRTKNIAPGMIVRGQDVSTIESYIEASCRVTQVNTHPAYPFVYMDNRIGIRLVRDLWDMKQWPGFRITEAIPDPRNLRNTEQRDEGTTEEE